MQAKDFKVGGDILDFGTAREAIIEPSSPFIYIPSADFFKVTRKLLEKYGSIGIKCNNDHTCRFDKNCDEVQGIDNLDGLLNITLYSGDSEFVINMDPKSMFVSGKYIDESNPDI